MHFSHIISPKVRGGISPPAYRSVLSKLRVLQELRPSFQQLLQMDEHRDILTHCDQMLSSGFQLMNVG